MDGGVVWNLDIASAVNKCRLLVDSDDKIILDVIDLDRSYPILPQWNTSGNAVSNYLRQRRIRDYFLRLDDEIEVQHAFPDVKYRYVISPKNELDPLYRELSLDHELIIKMINMGMEDAIDAI